MELDFQCKDLAMSSVKIQFYSAEIFQSVAHHWPAGGARYIAGRTAATRRRSCRHSASRRRTGAPGQRGAATPATTTGARRASAGVLRRPRVAVNSAARAPHSLRRHRRPLRHFRAPSGRCRRDHVTIRYDTIRDAILTCARKPT